MTGPETLRWSTMTTTMSPITNGSPRPQGRVGASWGLASRPLPVDEKVPGHGRGRGEAPAGPGGGEPQAEAAGGRPQPGQTDAVGGAARKSPETCPAAAPGRLPRGGRGIAHLDPGSAAVHGRAVAGPSAGGLSWLGPQHRRYPPGGVHPTGTGVCRFADHSRRELCPTTCMLP